MTAAFLGEAALAATGLKSCGRDVQLSPHAILINPQHITLGSHVRIDPFCMLSAGSAGIAVGDHVHLSVGVCLYGGGGRIEIGDFASVSAHCTLYTATDDFRDGWLSGPTVPLPLRRVETGDVILEPHALAGCGSVVLPGVTVGHGSAVGAMSLVKESIPAGALVAGIPARRIGSRNRERLLALQAELARESC